MATQGEQLVDSALEQATQAGLDNTTYRHSELQRVSCRGLMPRDDVGDSGLEVVL